MEIQMMPVTAITPYEKNPRKNDKAVPKTAESLQQYGFRQPIVVDKDMVIIAGHTRYKAALHLGMNKVPVHVADLSPEKVKAYRIADNRVGEEAEWDIGPLKLELEDLKELDFDLELTGFNMDELDAFFAEKTQGKTDEDQIPGDPTEIITQPGDVWVLGNHRIVCGDSTDARVVEKCLNGVIPNLMVTDPPYGVDYDPNWRAEAGVNKNKDKMGDVRNDDRADWAEVWSLFPGNIAYVWHGGLQAGTVAESLTANDFKIRSQIIWAKDRFALSRGDYHWQHEPCWYAVREKGHWAGDRSQSTIWNINSREDSGHGHSTQKPVECMRRPIINSSSPGQAVFEPFSGSGTTIIACETTGRICHAIELEPKYVDIAVKRWEDFTGKEAKREK